MKRTKAQINNLLDGIARFTLSVGDNYTIGYTPESLKFSSFVRAVDTNLGYWHSKRGDQSFYEEWQKLKTEINNIKGYLETVDDNPELDNNVLHHLRNYLSSDVTHDSGVYTYNVLVSSPIMFDASWQSIDRFIDFYLDRVDDGRELPDAIRNSLYQSSNYSYYPALFILKNELSPKNVSIKNFERKILQPVKEGLGQLSREADEGQQELTRFIEEKYREVQTKLDKNVTDMDNYRSKVDVWQAEKQEALNGLEETYKNKLKLEAPEKLWNERSEKYRRRASFWTWWLAGVVVILLASFALFVHSLHEFPKGISDHIPFLSQQVLFIGVISFFVYIIRVMVKIVMSNHHIAMEYEQKAAFARFYQALTHDGLEVNDNEKLVIINSLFSRVDPGLVKTSESTDTDSVLALISRNSGK